MKHHPKGCGIKYFTKCPSQQLLKSMFTYKDGQLTGRFQVPGMERNYFAGKTIGTFDITNPLKCKKVLISGNRFYINRLIWVYFNGVIEEGNIIQFKDGNAHNCRIENLMSVPQNKKDIGIQYEKNRNEWRLRFNEKREKVYSEKIEEATTLILDMQYKDMHSEISWLLQQAYLQTGTYHTSPKRNVNDLVEAFNLTEAKG
tara:strand:- start:10 stop:612 length:603 start_codon:yes stop_codon:yes gene_type:complete